jgi:hypothetical protein
MATEDPRDYVITMHGVGKLDPGSTLTHIAQHYQRDTNVVYRSIRRLIDGVPCTCYESDRPQAPTLLEVSWVDIRHPQASWRSVLWHLGRLLVAMLELADRWHPYGRSRPVRWPLVAYRLLIELSVWSLPYIVYVMLLASLTGTSRVLVSAGITTAVLAIAVRARHWSRVLAVSGVVWSVVYGVVGWVAVTGSATWPDVMRSASTSYVYRHQIFPFLVLALFAVCLLTSRTLTVEQRITRFLLAYLPMLAMAVAGAVLWVIAIPPVANTEGYRQWSDLHSEVLRAHHYDLALAEYAHLASIASFGVGALFVALGYLVGQRNSAKAATLGERCRNAVPVLALLVPLGAVGLAAIVARDVITARIPGPANVLDVYTMSALRVLPFLPWLFGPMRIVLDVLGDVVLTSLPADHPMSIARQTQDRLAAALAHVAATKPRAIVLLSHSLGTFFAARATMAPAAPPFALITTGSPLTSLQQRFLGIRTVLKDDSGPLSRAWVNLYRGGDYIGGELDLPSMENVYLGPGGHTGYWGETVVVQTVRSAVEQSRQPATTSLISNV